ncbi:MAG TPA: YjgN family protein [Rhizomicrobium sp.]|nr:YjgN family protein [Rhizomicrobium sp.]
MDTKPLTPESSARHTFRFEGSAGEYFKIWIVNLALSVVTLGIFSAWAKVRSKRYLYGNTFIGAHAFDYHAQPLRILLGRAIAVTLILIYSLTLVFAKQFIGLLYLIFGIALPWLAMSSLRFSARNTSYRNIRFDFEGDYGGAFAAYILWQGLAAITLFIAFPFAHRARDYYTINNHCFGSMPFSAEIPVGELYLIYLAGLGAFLSFIVGGALLGLGFSWLTLRPVLSTVTAVEIPAYVLGFLTAASFVGARTLDLALNNTRLGKAFWFESRLSGLRMAWIVTSNLVVSLVTLGLLYPWARVRRARYMASCISVVGPAELDISQAAIPAGGSAVGEEIAGFFDVDFGL